MAGGIRSLDSFMENYSEPAWLDEKPQSFASALKEWQQIQNNYYKNDKAKMELEDKEEQREKNKEREKKMLELGLTLDPDDLRGSLRKVIDFSNGEGDINTSLSIMGRLYQMDQADKREREAAARKALGITKKEQKELEKKAREVKTSGYLMSSVGNGGLTPDAINNSITLAAQDGNWRAAKDLADLKKSVFGTGSNGNGSGKSSIPTDPVELMIYNKIQAMNNALRGGGQNEQPVNLSPTTTKSETHQPPAGSKVQVGQTFIRQGKLYVRTLQGDVPVAR